MTNIGIILEGLQRITLILISLTSSRYFLAFGDYQNLRLRIGNTILTLFF